MVLFLFTTVFATLFILSFTALFIHLDIIRNHIFNTFTGFYCIKFNSRLTGINVTFLFLCLYNILFFRIGMVDIAQVNSLTRLFLCNFLMLFLLLLFLLLLFFFLFSLCFSLNFGFYLCFFFSLFNFFNRFFFCFLFFFLSRFFSLFFCFLGRLFRRLFFVIAVFACFLQSRLTHFADFFI